MPLKRMTLFLELLFSRELIKRKFISNVTLREHTARKTMAKNKSSFCSQCNVTFDLSTKCTGVCHSEKKLGFTTILTSYFLRTLGFFTARLLQLRVRRPCSLMGKFHHGCWAFFAVALRCGSVLKSNYKKI